MYRTAAAAIVLAAATFAFTPVVHVAKADPFDNFASHIRNVDISYYISRAGSTPNLWKVRLFGEEGDYNTRRSQVCEYAKQYDGVTVSVGQGLGVLEECPVTK